MSGQTMRHVAAKSASVAVDVCGRCTSRLCTAMDDRPPILTARAEPSASSVNPETANATHLTFSQNLQTVQEPDVSHCACCLP